ncbi:MAG: hypothetical protein WB767_14420 [Nocardioides sp.]
MRWGIGSLGVVAGVYGAYLLLSRAEFEQHVSVGKWLAGSVIAHDGLIAFATIAAVALAGKVLPRFAQAPAVVGLVVLGSLTIIAVPFLGRFGARDDNPTLLDRNYVAGWAIVMVLGVAAVVVSSLRRRRALAPVAAPDEAD